MTLDDRESADKTVVQNRPPANGHGGEAGQAPWKQEMASASSKEVGEVLETSEVVLVATKETSVAEVALVAAMVAVGMVAVGMALMDLVMTEAVLEGVEATAILAMTILQIWGP